MPNLRKLIFENEAVDGISSPIEYPYIKILRFTLSVVGAWPLSGSKSLTKLIRGFFSIVLPYTVVAAFTYVILRYRVLSFIDIGPIYMTGFMTVVHLTRHITVTLNIKHRTFGSDFLTKMHLFFYKDKSDYAMQTHKQIHLFCHLYTLFILGQMLGGLALYNLIPMYNNYSAGRYKNGPTEDSPFELSVYYSYPFDVTTNVVGYSIICVVNWFISYLCATWFCLFDLFVSLMVIHIWGHFKILINNLYSIPKPTNKSGITVNTIVINELTYSEAERQSVLKKLTECIDYHRNIVIFTNRVSDTYGPMLVSYYVFALTSGCLLLLECSQMTTAVLMRYLPLTVIVFQQLIQTSVIFELMGSETEKLKDAVYSVPWEFMDPKTRKLVAFFLMNVQEPIHVKAVGFVDIGVTSMAFIIKTSLSYFTFLRSL